MLLLLKGNIRKQIAHPASRPPRAALAVGVATSASIILTLARSLATATLGAVKTLACARSKRNTLKSYIIYPLNYRLLPAAGIEAALLRDLEVSTNYGAQERRGASYLCDIISLPSSHEVKREKPVRRPNKNIKYCKSVS